uniref:Glycosyl transferase 64 domain-containing protein n=1 Tax=Anopheles dirus TaxID=7168 RepID=A0A182NVB9_9DIPT
MQAKKRYILVIICCAFLAYCYLGGYRLKGLQAVFRMRVRKNPDNLPSYHQLHYQYVDNTESADQNDLLPDDDLFASPLYESRFREVAAQSSLKGGAVRRRTDERSSWFKSCRMETCFDFSRCSDTNFYVYVYPPEPLNSLGAPPPISQNYQKIISAIQESRYYTTDPEQACLFVLGIDTLDRDSLSEDFVRNVPSRLQRLPHWNNGRNHIIFNLYSGTWPDYNENGLGFDPGQAILAKASMSVQSLRPGFDVSIPLFHKQFPLRGGNTGFVVSNNFPANKKYLLAFKGKRMGKAGVTYRMLDVMKIIENMIGFSKYCRRDAFRYYFQIHGYYHFSQKLTGNKQRFGQTKDCCCRFRTSYGQSLLAIIRERLPEYPHRNGLTWNTSPGALLTIPTFSDTHRRFPFLLDKLGYTPGLNYTAVIFVQIGTQLTPNTALYKLVKSITKSQFIDKILILWANDRSVPQKKRWPSTGHIPLHIISGSTSEDRPSISQRFYPHEQIETDAVLSLDEDAILNTDELDFAYQVWRDFPDRIVGYPARAHFWDDSKNAWGYTSKWTNYYSIVLTGAAFYHRYYNYLYTNWLSYLLLKTVQQSSNCEDILMNLLVSHVTRKPPIKVTQRKGYKDRESGRSPWNDPDHFIQRQSCLNTFAAVFGYMPLLRSNLRLDPVLYRDSVSNLRKKYRQIELVGS